MNGWVAKRFWTEVRVAPVGTGYSVLLDSRAVRTPAKALLAVPSAAMAAAIAVEWQAQQGKIDPRGMPVTCSANAAIDRVAVQQAEVVGLIAAYGDSDLLCYRAPGPVELVARQAGGWDPMLDWAAAEFGARLQAVSGVVHIAQGAGALDRLTGQVAALTAFELTALHDLVALSGSLVLGLAVLAGFRSSEALWELSRIDESWQIELWGTDAEAGDVAALKRAAFLHAERFYRLCRD